MIPEFAILGHPNEGKSSVLSTLAEDDTVQISATPGETKECRTFPVKIDGQEIIRFTDTPGFQNPGKMLYLLKEDDGSADTLLERFHERHHNDPEMVHDCELLMPLLRGAGIIYVADGSRPLRNVDLAEMEILRLSGKPRMAILNCKEDDTSYLDQWKTEFRKHFNSSRMFNAHRATYRERIRLLEALKSIEQDWHDTLDYVVKTFINDWQARNNRCADIICAMLRSCLRHSLTGSTDTQSAIAAEKEKLYGCYTAEIKKLESSHHQQIRKLFKHNIFNYQLPSQSIYHQDLFSTETWNVLGLRKTQLAVVGGVGGAALAATIDIAAGGASLGLFTTMGGALGALGAVYGSKNIASKIKFLGMSAGKYTIQVGPNANSQFPFILLDRVLIYYAHIINWTHGRRDYHTLSESEVQRGYSERLPTSSLKKVAKYFHYLQKDLAKAEQHEYRFKEELLSLFDTLSTTGNHEKDPLNGKNSG
ncbi:MAG: GTPase/DUF3482 domain-containing protein [Desulfocapsaceae bacterium]|nr:GTPase/DUF3482 domain-containing protein [Desulfocapsaceae bacterium]